MWRCTKLAAPSPETTRHLNPLSAFGQRNSFSFRSHWASGSKSTGNYYTSLLEVPDKSPPIHSPHVALTVCKGILCHLQNCGSRDKHLGVAGSIIIWRDIQLTADTQTSCFMSVLQKATPFPQHGICKLECWNGSRKKKTDFPAHHPTSYDAWGMRKVYARWKAYLKTGLLQAWYLEQVQAFGWLSQ